MVLNILLSSDLFKIYPVSVRIKPHLPYPLLPGWMPHVSCHKFPNIFQCFFLVFVFVFILKASCIIQILFIAPTLIVSNILLFSDLFKIYLVCVSLLDEVGSCCALFILKSNGQILSSAEYRSLRHLHVMSRPLAKMQWLGKIWATHRKHFQDMNFCTCQCLASHVINHSSFNTESAGYTFRINKMKVRCLRCLHPSRGLTAQGFLLLIPILSIFLMQELTGKFWNSSFVCFSSCLWLELFLKRSVKTPLTLNWTSTPYLYFCYCPLYRVWRQAGFFSL